MPGTQRAESAEGEIPARYCGDEVADAGAVRQDRRLAAWLDGIDDQDLCTSALVVREIWDGIESNPARAAELARQAADLLSAYEGRIVPVDSAVAMMWSKLLKGRKRR